MQLRILGPLEISLGGVAVSLTSAREQRLLALLLLAPNAVVPLRDLVDGVWDDQPPPSAKRQVQNRMSALRRRLHHPQHGELIVTDGPGYRIRVRAGQLDSEEFLRLIWEERRQGTDLTAAAELLSASLALWRGPALAGLTGKAIEAGAAVLEERRLAAYERYVDIQLELGHHAEVIGGLGMQVAANPLRERLIGQLMLALHRCARQAEALQAFDRLRTRLAEELGIDPSQELQQLRTTILRNEDFTVGQSRVDISAVPRQLPAVTRHFVGRQPELQQLDRLAVAVGNNGAAIIAAITGTAGIGKTTLAVHWAHGIADRFPDGQLYVNLRGFDPAGTPLDPAQAMRRLLDGLGVASDRMPQGLDEQAALYRTILAGRRILIILDNALRSEQVRPLLPGTATCLAIVTSRSQLTSLIAVEDAHPLSLNLLSTDEAQQLLSHRLGADRLEVRRQVIDEIAAKSAGLPLALAIVAARAAALPGLALATLADDLHGARDRLDALAGEDTVTDLRAVFSWSYQALSVPAANLFRLLGLPPGLDISLAAAASLTGVPAPQARQSMNELTDAHLLVEHLPGRYTFHDLLRAYATDRSQSLDSDHDRDAAMRRLLDHYLHTAYAAALLLNPSRPRITIVPPGAGATPESLHDQKAALAWLKAEHAVLIASIEHATAIGHDTHSWQLAWTLMNYLNRQGHWHDQITVHRAALASARRSADPVTVARAHRNLARAHMRLGDLDEGRAELIHALEVYSSIDDPDSRAETHRLLALSWEQQGRPRDALPHASAALEDFRAAANAHGEANALNTVGWCHALLGEYEEASVLCEQALAMQEVGNDLTGRAATWDSLGYIHLRLGNHARAIEAYEHSAALYREADDHPSRAETLNELGDAYRIAGDPAKARAAWRQALDIFSDLDNASAATVRAKLRQSP